MNAPVVVAYDQTPHSKRALAEGVREAVSRGTGIRIVHAYAFTERVPVGPHLPVIPPTGGVEQTNREDAEEILAELAAEIRAEHPELPVETRAVRGSAPAAIIEASADAVLLVVGSRGRGGFAGLLLGSTSQRVLADAHCPVVVVHDIPAAANDRVLVGVDLDHPCDTLLEFAFDAASRRGAELLAVNSWDEPWTMAFAAGTGAEDGLAYEQQRADRLKNVLDPWRAKYPDVAVTVRLYATTNAGTAGSCLVEASNAADLLVIGTHPLTGHRHATRLGPVAHTTLHHARCPVAVVPAAAALR